MVLNRVKPLTDENLATNDSEDVNKLQAFFQRTAKRNALAAADNTVPHRPSLSEIKREAAEHKEPFVTPNLGRTNVACLPTKQDRPESAIDYDVLERHLSKSSSELEILNAEAAVLEERMAEAFKAQLKINRTLYNVKQQLSKVYDKIDACECPVDSETKQSALAELLTNSFSDAKGGLRRY